MHRVQRAAICYGEEIIDAPGNARWLRAAKRTTAGVDYGNDGRHMMSSSTPGRDCHAHAAHNVTDIDKS